MTEPLVMLTPRASHGVDGPIDPDVSAAVEKRDGVWWLAERTVNAVANPEFATNTDGYTATRATITRVTDVPALHPTAARIDFEGSEFSQDVVLAVTSGASGLTGDVTASFYALGTAEIRTRVSVTYHDDTRAFGTFKAVTLSGSPERVVSVPIRTDPSKAVSRVELMIQSFTATPDTIHISKVQIEAKPYATPYTVGTRHESEITTPYTEDVASVLVRAHDGSSEELYDVPLSYRAEKSNIVRNPRFRSFMAGWEQPSSGPVLMFPDAGETRNGIPSLQATRGANTDVAWIRTPSDTLASQYISEPVAGETYTFSVYVKASKADRVLVTLGFRSGSSPVLGGTFTEEHSVGLDWTRVSVTGVAPEGTDGCRVELRINLDAPTEGDVTWINSPQLEKGGIATSYVDGDMPGVRWDRGAITSGISIAPDGFVGTFAESGIVIVSEDVLSLHATGTVGVSGVLVYREPVPVETVDWLASQASWIWHAIGGEVPEPVPVMVIGADGSRNRDGYITAEEHGSARIVASEHGQAWQLAESGENLVLNPLLEVGGTLWSSTRCSIERSTAEGPNQESQVLAITHTSDTSSNSYTYTFSGEDTLSEGVIRTSSVWARSDVQGASIDVWAYTYKSLSGWVDRHVKSFPLSTEWQRYVFTAPPASATTTTGAFGVTFGGASVGDVMYIAEPQMEKKPYATPFIAGDMGPGYAWTGTPNASTSTRAGAHVTFDAARIDTRSGSAFLRYRSDLPQNALNNQYMMLIGGTSTGDGIAVQRVSDRARLRVNAGTAANIFDAPFSESARGLQSLYIEWTESTIGIQSQDGPFQVAYRSDDNDPLGFIYQNLGFIGIITESIVMTGIVETVVFLSGPVADEARRQEFMSYDGTWTWTDTVERFPFPVVPIPPLITVPSDFPEPVAVMSVGEGHTRAGPVPVTQSSTVEIHDNAWRLSPGFANLVANPSFEQNTTGWVGTNAGLSRHTLDRAVGFASLAVVSMINGANARVRTTTTSGSSYSIPVEPNTTYTVSFWIRETVAGDHMVFHGYRDASGAAIPDLDGETVYVTATTAWTRVSYQITTPDHPDVGTTTFILYQRTNATAFSTYYIDGVQIERGDQLSDFMDGERVAGTVAIPLATAPEMVAVRVREGDDIVTYTVELFDGYGEAGGVTVTHDAGVLTLGATDRVDVVSAAAFGRVLTSEELDALDRIERWGWWSLVPPSRWPVPVYESGMYRMVPRIYEATRENDLVREITDYVTDANADMDVDRSGAKWRLSIESVGDDLLLANQWIAPFLRVIPEQGEIADNQLGLYLLGEPDVTFDVAGARFAQNRGDDIIKIIDDSVLTDPQITNPNINVMGEVWRSVQIATMEQFGPNIFPYTYLRPTVDWGQSRGSDSSGWLGTDELSTNPGRRPRGDYSWMVDFNPGIHGGAYRYMNALTGEHPIPVPEGASQIYLSHYRHATHPFLRSKFEVRFFRADGSLAARVGDELTAPELTGTWLSHIVIADVPSDAVEMGFLPMVETASPTDSGMGTVRMHLAGFEVGVARGTPISRHALPLDSRTATTAISHAASTSWLERIDDLLQAIGYRPLTATADGRPTTRPLVDAASDTPTRTYVVNEDSRLVGEISTRRTTGGILNVVVAIKEDFETKTAMVAVARNDDPDHPWSTKSLGRVIAPAEPVMVMDAVDQQALQDIADARLAAASTQQDVSIRVLPDAELVGYDVIRLVSDRNEIDGAFMIQSISWGMVAQDPLVEIGARRTFGSRGVTDED